VAGQGFIFNREKPKQECCRAMSPTRSSRPVGTRQIHVIDGLFDDAFIGLLAGWLDTLTFGRTDFDAPGLEEFRHFKREIPADLLESHPLYRQLQRAVSAEADRYYAAYAPRLTRAYVNLVVFGDHHSAHYDTERGVTAIYYANREWSDDWHGETMFYADNEPVSAIAPRPGRLALLPADMTHRVGNLSRLCNAARYTLAFKFETAEIVA
jgi:hypothetical protein